MRKRSGRITAVVDTNLFVSGLISKHGAPYRLIEALRTGAFTLIVSPALQSEYVRVLARPRFREKYGLNESEVADFLFLIGSTAQTTTPRRRLPVSVRDKKDEQERLTPPAAWGRLTRTLHATSEAGAESRGRSCQRILGAD
ncbi:MAG: putative toxin-antitoxin system toxin component, PIN family [Chloroflexi bacterium]|nr:putative toxin-antitoxin system toxin component, PIN family [Chloroflexota bacterium]